jgi:hypothetical protein
MCLIPVPLRAPKAAKRFWGSLAGLDILSKVRQWTDIKGNQLASCFNIAVLSRPHTIASPDLSISSLSTLPSTPTSSLLSLDTDMASTHCSQLHCPQVQASELWITYHQASRAHKQVTAQLVDISDATHLFDLEDVLDYVFQQGFVDAKWRSVTWWEDSTSTRLKACTTVQDLLARGAGNTSDTSLHLIVGTPHLALLFRGVP